MCDDEKKSLIKVVLVIFKVGDGVMTKGWISDAKGRWCSRVTAVSTRRSCTLACAIQISYKVLVDADQGTANIPRIAINMVIAICSSLRSSEL
jgi:hypothetical protein